MVKSCWQKLRVAKVKKSLSYKKSCKINKIIKLVGKCMEEWVNAIAVL